MLIQIIKFWRVFAISPLCPIVIFSACEPNQLDYQVLVGSVQNLESMGIPYDFNFETERTVTMTINNQTPHVKYQVNGYSSQFGSEAENIANALNNIIYTGKPHQGTMNQTMSLSNALQ